MHVRLIGLLTYVKAFMRENSGDIFMVRLPHSCGCINPWESSPHTISYVILFSYFGIHLYRSDPKGFFAIRHCISFSRDFCIFVECMEARPDPSLHQKSIASEFIYDWCFSQNFLVSRTGEYISH